MLKVTLSDYTVVYVKTMGEALEKAYKLGHIKKKTKQH